MARYAWWCWLLTTCVATACGGGSSSTDPDGGGPVLDSGTGDASTGADDASTGSSDFLSPCEEHAECESGVCLIEHGLCSRLCTSDYVCPGSAEWRCLEPELGPPRFCTCTAPGPDEFGACDPDCDGTIDPTTGAWQHSVQLSLLVPANDAEVDDYGLDLDGDENVDNALGDLFAALAEEQGLDVQTPNDQAAFAGDLLLLHSLRADDLVTDECAGWRVHSAVPTTPDFSGSGEYTVETPGRELRGSIVEGVFTSRVTGEGNATVRFVFGTEVVTAPIVATRVKALVAESGDASGVLAGAILEDDLDATVVTAFVKMTQERVETDPEAAPLLLEIYDEDGNGELSDAEIRDHAVTQVLFLPDLDLRDGAGNPGIDGENDAFSLGFGFSAVGAVYTEPSE